MKKHGKLLTFLCAALLTVTLAAGGTAAFADEPSGTPFVAENVPFFDNPQNPGKSTIVKTENGSYNVDQPESGGGARIFYGDYTHGSDEHPYLMDLTDVTLRVSIDRLASGGQLFFAFMAHEKSGNVYPMGTHGQGIALRFADDGNHGFMPAIVTYTRDSSNEPSVTGNQYFVYNNGSPRTSYLGKEFTIHIYVQGTDLHMDATWTRDDVNAETAYDFRAQIPLADLPAEGKEIGGTTYAGFDYTQAFFMLTNNNSVDGAAITLYELSEKNTNDYYAAMGGQTEHTLNVISAFTQAVKDFPESSATADEIEAFYTAQQTFAEKAADMRKCDAFEHAQALEAAASKVDPVAAESADVCIAAIGTVENTAACKEKIDAARALYNVLPASVQAKVTNYATLEKAETDYAALMAEAEEQAAADAVSALIAGIGAVENTADCKEKIDAARAAYNALSASAQAKVTNYATLEKAETDYAALSANGGNTGDGNNGGENKAPEKSGCSSTTEKSAWPLAGAVILCGAASLLALRKKRA